MKPLPLLESAETFDLPAKQVLVLGDTHGSTGWVHALRDGGLPQTLAAEPTPVTTVLSLGDWGYWQKHRLNQFDSLLRRSGIDLALITLGNHEEYDTVAQVFDEAPAGHAVRISSHVWVLPRPFRFRIGGRSVLSFGGAASVDVGLRREGVDWWPDEMPSDEQAAAAIAGGAADVMLTHECVDGSCVAVVDEVLASNPLGWPESSLNYSAASRSRVTEVWNAVAPELLLHGHMHVRGTGATGDGRRVESLACDQMPGSVGLLRFDDLSLTDLNGDWLR